MAGCNSYGVEIKALDERTLRLGGGGATLVGCDLDVMEFERAYYDALSDVASYWVSGGRLEMYDAAGESVLIFLSR